MEGENCYEVSPELRDRLDRLNEYQSEEYLVTDSAWHRSGWIDMKMSELVWD